MSGNVKKTCKILVVVDMQKDFIDGSLGTKEAQAIVPNVLEKVKNFKGDYIIFTRDTHNDDYLFSKEGEKLPVKHCIQGTKGWEIEKSLRKWIDDNHFSQGIPVGIIDKPTFGSVPMNNGTPNVIGRINEIIERTGAKEVNVEICGLITDICVLHNAIILKSFFYDNGNITVDSSCCAGSTPENHQKALDIMAIGHINIK